MTKPSDKPSSPAPISSRHSPASSAAASANAQAFRADALKVNAFARAQATFDISDTLSQWPRLWQEHLSSNAVEIEPVVHWQARGEYREQLGAQSGAWLFVCGTCSVVKTCQRCMQPVTLHLSFDHAYRFVPTEAEADALDMESEEDVLAYDDAFNLLELVEDELLLAIPAIPRHDSCGGSVQYEWMDADFEKAQQEEKSANPFAVLQQLKKSGD